MPETPTQNLPQNRNTKEVALDVQGVRDWLMKMKTELASALPSQVPVDRFIRVVQTSVRRNPKLLECEPMSLFGAILTSAQIGLVPDGVLGEAYIIPRWNSRRKRNEANFQPGYQGVLALCRRSGKIARVNAQVVYEKELTSGKFRYQEGDEPRIEHEPILIGEKGNPVLVYATATLTTGEKQIAVVTKEEVEKIRDLFSKAGDSGPWKDPVNWKWMWKKTALIQLAKLLPKDTEDQNMAKAREERAPLSAGAALATAIALDEKVMIDAPQDLAIEADPNAEGDAQEPIEDETPKQIEKKAETPAPATPAPKGDLFKK